MADKARRQRLLKQVARLREIEHRAAAAAASAALVEAAHGRRLADRAAALVAGYAELADVKTAHDLASRRYSEFRMRAISQQAGVDADRAAAAAELRVAGERQARRRREAIDEMRAAHALEANKPASVSGESAGLARFLNKPAENQ